MVAKVRKASASECKTKRRPAITPEARENQLISLATNGRHRIISSHNTLFKTWNGQITARIRKIEKGE